MAGFTLVELMIVVAIAAILAAIAIPSYSSYVQKSRRSEAWTLLQSAQLAQEKHRLSNASYAASTGALVGACPATGDCVTTNYSLAVTASSATGFTLTASVRTGTPQVSDTSCQTISLQSSGSTLSYSPAACWNR